MLIAQNSFEDQFNFAKKLYEQENYFDAVTEFKRLLFFENENTYNYEANFLIGLSYKNGALFSDAIQYFTKAELESKTEDELLRVTSGNNQGKHFKENNIEGTYYA